MLGRRHFCAMMLPNKLLYQIRAKEGPGGGDRNVVFSICVQLPRISMEGAPAKVYPSWKAPRQEHSHVGLDKRESSNPAPITLSFSWSGGSFASAAVMKTFDFIFFTRPLENYLLGEKFRRSSKHVICTGARPGVELLQMHPKSQPGCLHVAV